MASKMLGRKMIFANNKLATDYIATHDIGICYVGPHGDNGEVVLMYIENDKTDNVNHPAHYTSSKKMKQIFANRDLAEEFAFSHCIENNGQIEHYFICPYGAQGEYAVYYKEKENSMNDNVNHPAHYTSGGIECIDGMVAAFGREYVMHYCLCNAFKYIWRCEHKGKRVEDIQKAVWYLNKWQSLAGEEAMSDE